MQERAVLVVSCDRYADLWPVFFALFWKYWPDCPLPVYLGTNHGEFNDDRVKALRVGNESNWSHDLRVMLEQLREDSILVLLEDFLLQRRVVNNKIDECFQAAEELNAGYLRLRPFPPPDKPVEDFPFLGTIAPCSPYRAAFQAAIWDRRVLLELLEDGETPWQMEYFGSRRSDRLPCGFYSTRQPRLHYYAAVSMGKWRMRGRLLCMREQVKPDLSARPMHSIRETVASVVKGLYLDCEEAILPWSIRRRIVRRRLDRHFMQASGSIPVGE